MKDAVPQTVTWETQLGRSEECHKYQHFTQSRNRIITTTPSAVPEAKFQQAVVWLVQVVSHSVRIAGS
jgi:hypothetical protein